MKKNSLLILILMMLLLTSCQYHTYVYDDVESFLDRVYVAVNTEKATYAMIDLRDQESYLTSHIKQFQNFDISQTDTKSFITWLKSNFSSKYDLYIYSTDSDVEILSELKGYYKNIYFLSAEYDKILEDERIVFQSGEYDCGC